MGNSGIDEDEDTGIELSRKNTGGEPHVASQRSSWRNPSILVQRSVWMCVWNFFPPAHNTKGIGLLTKGIGLLGGPANVLKSPRAGASAKRRCRLRTRVAIGRRAWDQPVPQDHRVEVARPPQGFRPSGI